jgi:spore germination cell wall hydrolase CwlJ-like protein
MLLVTVILVAGINLVSNIDDAMTEREIQKAVLSEEKVAKIEDYSPTSTYSGSLTPQELDIVCRVVAAEARGEDLQGQMAVAQVIRDRSQLWGMTVTEVCLAPGQFAAPYQGEISAEVVQAVWAIFDQGMSVFDEPVTHFHADYVSPYWTESKVSRGTVGAHRFYGE